jgi:hypothetical protein
VEVFRVGSCKNLDRDAGNTGGVAMRLDEFYAAHPLRGNAPIQKSGATV